jgi:hypothetical protein
MVSSSYRRWKRLSPQRPLKIVGRSDLAHEFDSAATNSLSIIPDAKQRNSILLPRNANMLPQTWRPLVIGLITAPVLLLCCVDRA